MMADEQPCDQGILTHSWKHKRTIAICCLLFILFMIASAIVLSLIPLYLSTKDMSRIDNNEDSMSILLVVFVLNELIFRLC